jgi:hypothetical protein
VATDCTRPADRLLDGVTGDLVEDHPPDRDRRLEHLVEVPGDRLALAVLVRREVELVCVLERPLELADLLPLVRVDDVVGLEVAVDVDRELAEPALLLGSRQLGGRREVTDVADAGLHLVARAEVALDRLRFRRRLDDHQAARPGRGRACVVRAGHAARFPRCWVRRSPASLPRRPARPETLPRPTRATGE